MLALRTYKKEHKIRFPPPGRPLSIPAKAIQDIINRVPVKVAITNAIDENWGFFSTIIGNRTTRWLNMTNHLGLHYSNHDMVKALLDSEKILFITCNTHVDPLIGFHEKIVPLPLGIKSRDELFRQAKFLLSIDFKKTKVLTINNSGWGDRKLINEMVSKSFNYSVHNSYDLSNSHTFEYPSHLSPAIQRKLSRARISKHLFEIASSQFVLCPSGLGMDTYRLWETLLLGSIPIVESNEGFNRVYSRLPVLVVPNYSVVTPELLNRSYPCFVKHSHHFHYRSLLESYWLDLIFSSMETQSIDRIQEYHPVKNPYCFFF